MDELTTTERARIEGEWATRTAPMPAAGRPEPELHRMAEWLTQEADRYQALVSQMEDALAAILPRTDEGERGTPMADARTGLGQTLAGIASRLDASNARVGELLERVRVAL